MKKLSIPCSGQSLIERVNYISSRANECIGDIKYTLRNDLGENYLLCNGGTLCAEDGYGELIEYINACGNSKWYHKFDIPRKNENINISDVYTEVNGKIYQIHIEVNVEDAEASEYTTSFYLRKYNSNSDFTNQKYEEAKIYETKKSKEYKYHVSKLFYFREKLYIGVSECFDDSDHNLPSFYVLSSRLESALGLWGVQEFNNSRLSASDYPCSIEIECLGDYLLVFTNQIHSYNAYSTGYSYVYKTSNGDDFTWKELNSRNGAYGGDGFSVSIINKEIVLGFSADSYIALTSYNPENDTYNSFGIVDLTIGNIYCTNVVSYNGKCIIFNVSIDGIEIFTATYNGTNTKWERAAKHDYTERGKEYALKVCTNGNENVLLFGNYIMDGSYNLTKVDEYTSDILKNNFMSLNGATKYVSETDSVVIDYASDAGEDTNGYLISRKNEIAILPTLSSDVGYVYVKAKE